MMHAIGRTAVAQVQSLLRGFLQEYASALGREPRRAAEAHMALLPPS